MISQNIELRISLTRGLILSLKVILLKFNYSFRKKSTKKLPEKRFRHVSFPDSFQLFSRNFNFFPVFEALSEKMYFTSKYYFLANFDKNLIFDKTI